MLGAPFPGHGWSDIYIRPTMPGKRGSPGGWRLSAEGVSGRLSAEGVSGRLSAEGVLARVRGVLARVRGVLARVSAVLSRVRAVLARVRGVLARVNDGGLCVLGVCSKMQEPPRKRKKKCECLIDFLAASAAPIAPPTRPSARRARHRGCPTAPRGPARRSHGRRPPTRPLRKAPTGAEKVPRPKMCPPVGTFPRIQPGAPGHPPGAQEGSRRRALSGIFCKAARFAGQAARGRFLKSHYSDS